MTESEPRPVFLIQDPAEAFKLWIERGLRGLTVVHLAAHPGFAQEVVDGDLIGDAKLKLPTRWDELHTGSTGAYL